MDDVFATPVSLKKDFCWMPYKKGETVQCWYMFNTAEECRAWLRGTNLDCWRGFRPARFDLRKRRTRKRG